MGFSYQKTYNFFLNQMDNNIRALISDLKAAMEKKTTGTKNGNW